MFRKIDNTAGGVPPKKDIKPQVKPQPKDIRPKTTDVTATKGTDFEEYYLKENLMMGLVEKGFDKPSPVQEECIPLILAGKNLIARAKNGTGKTGAYVIPTLEKLDIEKKYIQGFFLEKKLKNRLVKKKLSTVSGPDKRISSSGFLCGKRAGKIHQGGMHGVHRRSFVQGGRL